MDQGLRNSVYFYFSLGLSKIRIKFDYYRKIRGLRSYVCFYFSIGLSKIAYFKDYLQEPMEKLTPTIRTAGVVLAITGTFGVLYVLQTI